MNKLDVLLKCVLLLYREHEIIDSESDNSKDLIKTILGLFKDEKKIVLGGEHDVFDDLKSLIVNMLNNNDIDKESLIQSLSVILRDKESILNNIEKNINTEMSQGGLKKSILSLRNHLNNFYKQTEITTLLNRSSYTLNTNRLEEPISDFVSKLITNLEALSNVTKTKDPGIMDEVDIEDDEGLDVILTKVKKQTSGEARYKTGWYELNVMLNGGFRAGEMVVTSALQHNYKSGLLQSLFAQLCMYNKPTLINKDKKPLNLFISLEDDSEIILNFLYRYLYYSEHYEVPDLNGISTTEMAKYIKAKLTATGFHIKILRVNPSDWTYKHLFNKILEYEANGYEIKILFIDYLSKLPTTGCDTSGPQGTAVRDLFNRVRNVCAFKGILNVHPHQMSVDAKQLLRNGIPKKDLVKEVVGKGYYEGSRQIDQVVDVEILQCIAPIGKKHYLTIQRGKRRFPEIIDEEKKYFMLPFPHKAPIPPNIDLEGKYIGFPYSKEDNKIGLSEGEKFGEENDELDFQF